MRKLFWLLVLLTVIAVGLGYFVLNNPKGQNFAFEQLVDRQLQAAPFNYGNADALRVFMCGTSSPLPDPNRAQACIAVIVAGEVYVVDAGAGSGTNLNLGQLPMGNLKGIFLTHFHSDHISALGDINLISWVAGRQKPLNVYGPAGVEQVVSGFNQAYLLDAGYRTAHHGEERMPSAAAPMRFEQIKTSQPVLVRNGLTITAFEVDHTPIKPAVGYRFDYKGRSVAVSGDTVVTETLLDAVKGVDLLLHDALSEYIISTMAEAMAQTNPAGNKILTDILDYHAHTDDLQAMKNSLQVDTLALYHLIPPPRNILLNNIFRRDLSEDVIITKDGMLFELPAADNSIKQHQLFER